MSRPALRRLATGQSRRLGRLEVVRDREGTKLLAHGTLYAIAPAAPEQTPAPWLALAAIPLMLHERSGVRSPLRIGLLGYGAGTVARLLRRAGGDLELHAVDADAAVLRLARMHFDGIVAGVRLRKGDARDWLRAPGPRFDAILDDLYAPRDGRLSRPAELEVIPGLAKRRLVRGGLYAVNLRSPGGVEEREMLARIERRWRHVRIIYTHDYAHKVAVAGDRPIPRGAVSRALRRLLEPEAASGRPTLRLPDHSLAALGFREIRRPRTSTSTILD